MNWSRKYTAFALLVFVLIVVLAVDLLVAQKSPGAGNSYETIRGAHIPELPTFYDSELLTKESPLEPSSITSEYGADSNFLSLYFSQFPTDENKTAPSSVLSYIAPSKVETPQEETSYDAFWSGSWFTPRGLISTAITKEIRSPEEELLFDFGNRLGAHIQQFENTHPDTTGTLSAFLPQSGGFSSLASAKNGVLRLASDYKELGAAIARVDSVPKEAQMLNESLANGYREVGKGLEALANSKNDSELLAASSAYDDYANAFVENFLAIADFFSAHGIKFKASDPGNVFSLDVPGIL